MLDPSLYGPWRQISRRIRVQRGSGRPDLVSERPVKGSGRRPDGSWAWADSEEAPTLVTFDEHCRVDPLSMVAQGSLVAWVPPASAPAPERSGP